MAMGNALGVDVQVPEAELFSLGYGSAVVESRTALNHPCAVELGVVTASGIKVNGCEMALEALEKAYEGRYFKLYPPRVKPAFDPCASTWPTPAISTAPTALPVRASTTATAP